MKFVAEGDQDEVPFALPGDMNQNELGRLRDNALLCGVYENMRLWKRALQRNSAQRLGAVGKENLIHLVFEKIP